MKNADLTLNFTKYIYIRKYQIVTFSILNVLCSHTQLAAVEKGCWWICKHNKMTEIRHKPIELSPKTTKVNSSGWELSKLTLRANNNLFSIAITTWCLNYCPKVIRWQVRRNYVTLKIKICVFRRKTTLTFKKQKSYEGQKYIFSHSNSWNHSWNFFI